MMKKCVFAQKNWAIAQKFLKIGQPETQYSCGFQRFLPKNPLFFKNFLKIFKINIKSFRKFLGFWAEANFNVHAA